MKSFVLLLLMPWLLLSRPTVNLIVVDQWGMPVEDCEISIGYYEKTFSGTLLPPKKETIKSAHDGCTDMDMSLKRWVEILDAKKDGYVYERYLNPSRNKVLTPNRAPQNNPHRIVLRKKEQVRSFCLSCNYDNPYYCDGEGGKPIAVDLYAASRRKYGSKDEGYRDFYVCPSFHAKSNCWTVAFWTTNECSGVIATTNRVFVAPEKGYMQRVEVSQDVYTNSSFTLYLRTRTPQVYIMLPFDNESADVRTKPSDPRFHISIPRSILNPYGRREFEYDDHIEVIGREFARDLTLEAWGALLLDRIYPLHPDLKARSDNLTRRRKLEDEISKWHVRRCELNMKIDEFRKSHPGATKEEVLRATAHYQTELESSQSIYRTKALELNRLCNEAHSLNISGENSTSK